MPNSLAEVITKVAAANDAGKRFDKVARKAFNWLPLSTIFKSIRTGELLLNGHKTKPDTIIQAGDSLQLKLNHKLQLINNQQEINPHLPVAKGPLLEIIYQNTDVVIINKAYGLKVHDGAESVQKLILNQINYEPSLSFNPAPVHRLDRNTSGLLVIAKTVSGARLFGQHQADSFIIKKYLAVLKGKIKDDIWQDYLSYKDGKSYAYAQGSYAETKVTALAYQDGLTLAQLQLKTGRSHQIRCQAALHGSPLLNDVKYGAGGNGHYLLHAYYLEDIAANPLFPALTHLPAFCHKFLKNTKLFFN
ncbi:MAG: RluA family pseudouridine synthase [Spirochaetaceae bacterium]|nr:RluA family pseudouridine synthase [Spirochaetaceae bacterium]